MESEIRIRLVLVDPPAGIDFGVQRGTGASHEPVFVQRSTRGDIAFDLRGLTWTLIRKAATSGGRVAARVPGTARDGGPNCATVELLDDWKVVSADD